MTETASYGRTLKSVRPYVRLVVMILSHFAAKPFRLKRAYDYESKPHNKMKPRGFWLSDETSNLGWKEWCEGERFRENHLQHRIDFKCDTSRWLVLKDPFDILNFNHVYSPKDKDDALGFYIDWERVQKKYAGILITPYQWELRLHNNLIWYYGWDCASACVWDLSTIKRVPKWQPNRKSVAPACGETPQNLSAETFQPPPT